MRPSWDLLHITLLLYEKCVVESGDSDLNSDPHSGAKRDLNSDLISDANGLKTCIECLVANVRLYILLLRPAVTLVMPGGFTETGSPSRLEHCSHQSCGCVRD